MTYETIRVTPLIGAIGAEIKEVDLSQPLNDRQVSEIYDAFLQYQFICFRDQDLTPDDQKRIGRHFGEFCIHPFRRPLEGHPEIVPLIKEAEDLRNVGGGWHTDLTFKKSPPLGNILYAKEIPDSGGDTLFASTTLAYAALSNGMKEMLQSQR